MTFTVAICVLATLCGSVCAFSGMQSPASWPIPPPPHKHPTTLLKAGPRRRQPPEDDPERPADPPPPPPPPPPAHGSHAEDPDSRRVWSKWGTHWLLIHIVLGVAVLEKVFPRQYVALRESILGVFASLKSSTHDIFVFARRTALLKDMHAQQDVRAVSSPGPVPAPLPLLPLVPLQSLVQLPPPPCRLRPFLPVRQRRDMYYAADLQPTAVVHPEIPQLLIFGFATITLGLALIVSEKKPKVEALNEAEVAYVMERWDGGCLVGGNR